MTVITRSIRSTPRTSTAIGITTLAILPTYAAMYRATLSAREFSFGASAKVLYEFLDFATVGKTLHLIDPFAGTLSGTTNSRIATNYNRDPDYVMRQFPTDAPVVLHRQPIPIKLIGPLAFVYSDVGENVPADVAALPIFYDALSPGGVWISNVYAADIDRYQPVLDRLGVTPLWLPSGQGVIIKQ